MVKVPSIISVDSFIEQILGQLFLVCTRCVYYKFMCVHRKRRVAVRGFWSKQASLPSSAFILLDALKSLYIAKLLWPIFPSSSSICSTNSTSWNVFTCCSAIFAIHMKVFLWQDNTSHSADQNHLPTYFELSAVGEEVHVHICSNLKFQNSRILRDCQLESSSEWHLDFYLSLVIIWTGYISPYCHLMSISFILYLSKQ